MQHPAIGHDDAKSAVTFREMRSVEKVRFFLDQDSGMRAACLSAFADRIKDASLRCLLREHCQGSDRR
jgi:hypothetical protein